MTQTPDSLTRRAMLKGLGAAALLGAAGRPAFAAAYRPANTDWFANCRFGISTHWTAQSQPVGEDDWLPFNEAVDHFSPAGYVDQAARAGAEYVIFTGTHALQMLPAPSAAIDRIAPGRTTKRDMIGELADACHARGLRFILYYNHSCNRATTPAGSMPSATTPRTSPASPRTCSPFSANSARAMGLASTPGGSTVASRLTRTAFTTP